MNRRTFLKVSPYVCGMVAGLMFSQPIVAVSASVLEIGDVVKTKYSEEIKTLFDEMEAILVELEAVEDKYEAGKDEEYLNQISKLLPMFLSLEKLDEDKKFSEKRKDGDRLDNLFGRTVNILYELPMKQGHKLIKEFSEQLKENYFKTKYEPNVYMLRVFIEYNPDKALNSYFEECAIQLEALSVLPPDTSVNPDSIPGTVTGNGTPQFTDTTLEDVIDESLDEDWGVANNGNSSNSSNQTGSETNKKPTIQYIPAVKERVTYNVSYDVVGTQCVKTKEKLVNGVSKGVEVEIIPDGIAYRYCPTDRFFELYEGFETQDEGALSSSEANVVWYQYDGNDKTSLNFTIKEDKISYEELIGILDIVLTNEKGLSAEDSNKTLYAFGGKPLIIKSYEGEKSVDDVNKMLEKYVSLTLSIEV